MTCRTPAGRWRMAYGAPDDPGQPVWDEGDGTLWGVLGLPSAPVAVQSAAVATLHQILVTTKENLS